MSEIAAQPTLGPPPSIEELNAAIPNYEFRALFTEDASGALYRAYQPNLDRDVAIKVLPRAAAGETESFVEAFRAEARLLATLNHPNLIKVYDFGQTKQGHAYFVMEYVEGAILSQLIPGGGLTVDHICSWVSQVCDGLQYAHERGIFHGSLNSTNFLLTSDGEVKLANFGMAGCRTSGRVACAQEIVYQAPELSAPGWEIDYRADLYSLGVIVYEMLTGRTPQGAWALPSVVAGADERFDLIVTQAMAPDREERFQSALEISAILYEVATAPKPAPRQKLRFGKRD